MDRVRCKIPQPNTEAAALRECIEATEIVFGNVLKKLGLSANVKLSLSLHDVSACDADCSAESSGISASQNDSGSSVKKFSFNFSNSSDDSALNSTAAEKRPRTVSEPSKPKKIPKAPKKVSLVPPNETASVTFGDRAKNKGTIRPRSQSVRSRGKKPASSKITLTDTNFPASFSPFTGMPTLDTINSEIVQNRDGGVINSHRSVSEPFIADSDIMTIQVPNSPSFVVNYPQMMSSVPPVGTQGVQFAGFSESGPVFGPFSTISVAEAMGSGLEGLGGMSVYNNPGWNPSNPDWYPSGAPPNEYDLLPPPSRSEVTGQELMTVAVENSGDDGKDSRDVSLPGPGNFLK